MKPIKLTMSAFGSYAKETVIDFSDVQQGIFLITGDTGAGKTTIFDALVFALYDKTSGQKRDGTMMRSQYAASDVRTFVELVFSCRGKRYTVRRNPEYQRPRKRKSADGQDVFTTEKSSVALTMPDGSDYPGNKTAVNKKIVEILGLDVQQFTQIVMIAQGDFLRLLHAGSQERKQIFSRIFDTSIYRGIQEALKYRVKEGKGKLEDHRKALIREMEYARCPDQYSHVDEWEAQLRTAVMPDVDKVREHLDAMCILGKRQMKNLRMQSEEKQKSLEQIQISLEAGKAVNELFDRLKKAEEQKKMLDDQRGRAESLRVKKAAADRAKTVRLAEVQVETHQKHAEQLELQRKHLESELSKGREQITRTLEILEENCVKIQKNCEQASQSVREERNRYEEMYRTFLRAQAGLMAEYLEEGDRCPVCGSVHHPQKAALPGDAPKEQMVEAQKLSVERKSAQLERLQESFRKERTAKEEKHRELLLEISKKEGHLESLKLQIAEETELIRKAKTEFHTVLLQAGFKDEEAYRNARMEDKDLTELSDQLERYYESQIRVDENYRICREQTEGKEPVDLTNLEEARNGLKRDKAVIDHKYQELAVIQTKNEEAKEHIQSLQKEGEKLRREYEILLTLARTANGNLSQSIKLDFETYIQRQFFAQVIHSANQRFVRMTSGQLLLKCREKKDLSTQGQAGLDIDVYSPVTNSGRDVKTLSGGESFMAALSMALGMAEVISNTAGAVRMETMFIDEGFGSLDDDARAQAIGVLNELAGSERLVGIISHVTELKEQIDRKLVVERTDKGSQIHWEL